jgi:hypothetical protein
MIWRNTTFVTEEEMNMGPLYSMLEPVSRQQLINSPWRIAAGKSNTKTVKLAMKRAVVFDKPFGRGQCNLFGSVENENVGRNFHRTTRTIPTAEN